MIMEVKEATIEGEWELPKRKRKKVRKYAGGCGGCREGRCEDNNGENRPSTEKLMIAEIREKQKGEMMFQVCDVMRALACVARIVEKGNRVVFDEESFIQNKTKGKKIEMRKKGRAYVIDVVMENGKSEEITIDSAAEESVCPERWAVGCGIERVEKGKEMGLCGANGSKINHFGKRKVGFEAMVF